MKPMTISLYTQLKALVTIFLEFFKPQRTQRALSCRFIDLGKAEFPNTKYLRPIQSASLA